MPSPDDAPARAKRNAWRKHTFTPKMHANIRYRYEQTAESIDSIARRAAGGAACRASRAARTFKFCRTRRAAAPQPRPLPAARFLTGRGEQESVAQALAAHLARLNAIAGGIDEQIALVCSKQMLPQSPDEVRENARTQRRLRVFEPRLMKRDAPRSLPITRQCNSKSLRHLRHSFI
jgi:hypothetical protein